MKDPSEEEKSEIEERAKKRKKEEEEEKKDPETEEDFVQLFDADPDAWKGFAKAILKKEVASANPKATTVQKMSKEMAARRKSI